MPITSEGESNPYTILPYSAYNKAVGDRDSSTSAGTAIRSLSSSASSQGDAAAKMATGLLGQRKRRDGSKTATGTSRHRRPSTGVAAPAEAGGDEGGGVRRVPAGFRGERRGAQDDACSHSFHQRCIFGWLVIRDSCPRLPLGDVLVQRCFGGAAR